MFDQKSLMMIYIRTVKKRIKTKFFCYLFEFTKLLKIKQSNINTIELQKKIFNLNRFNFLHPQNQNGIYFNFYTL